MFAARRVTRVAKNSVRSMSNATQAEAIAEAAKWKQGTFVFLGLSAVVSLYNYAVHEHEHGETGYSYMKIRSKPFPWKCNDCDFYDLKCIKKCETGVDEDEEEEHAH